jgi:RNA polymerase sigma factor (sigma-70 family)
MKTKTNLQSLPKKKKEDIKLIVERWKATGDERHFKEIYRRLERGIYNHIFKITRCPDATNDIVSDTFISIYENINQYNPEIGAFSTWSFHIAKNFAMNWLNKEKRQDELRKNNSENYQRGSSRHNNNDDYGESKSSDSFEYAYDDSPVDTEEFHKIHQIVIQEVHRLSDTYRDCVYDRTILWLPYEEISKKHGLLLNTVKSKIRIGRAIVSENVLNRMKRRGISHDSIRELLPKISKSFEEDID